MMMIHYSFDVTHWLSVRTWYTLGKKECTVCELWQGLHIHCSMLYNYYFSLVETKCATKWHYISSCSLANDCILGSLSAVMFVTACQDQHEHKKRRVRVRKSIKRDCKAAIHIKETVQFPDFTVCTRTVQCSIMITIAIYEWVVGAIAVDH